MAAPTAGAGAAAPRMARLVHIGRSDGRRYTTEEINARRKTATKQVGEPIPEDINQIPDAETRRKVLLWKLVVATGVSEELGWPQGGYALYNNNLSLSCLLMCFVRLTIPVGFPRRLLFAMAKPYRSEALVARSGAL